MEQFLIGADKSPIENQSKGKKAQSRKYDDKFLEYGFTQTGATWSKITDTERQYGEWEGSSHIIHYLSLDCQDWETTDMVTDRNGQMAIDVKQQIMMKIKFSWI